MDVTPQLLHDVEFREAKRGGYNTQDVDDFLERVAVGVERQEAQLRELRQRVEAAEARAAHADQRVAEAERRVVESGDADETLKRTLVLAQRTADAAIREAEEQAARRLSAAEEEASRMLADAHERSARARADADEEARRTHEEAQARALAELRELESARDQLSRDVELLEAHLAEQRERLRESVAQLQRLLDDPDALEATPAPALSEVELPVATPPPAAAQPPSTDGPEPEEAAGSGDGPSAWMPEDDAWPEAEAPAPPPRSPAYADQVEADDDGLPTQAVDVLAERDADDDAYLAELRKAMTDDTPLGPRDDLDDGRRFETEGDGGRSRFGRRR